MYIYCIYTRTYVCVRESDKESQRESQRHTDWACGRRRARLCCARGREWRCVV